ncbi:ATP/GTP-binding protein [Sinomonas albida]|uniref:ATP/GTP-binding protein n=1 Tax=Sinomonas albida TaxID=369942 RepID=UPI0010A78134|nr:ATP/GTP-binding protein [Sinomonas albida]
MNPLNLLPRPAPRSRHFDPLKRGYRIAGGGYANLLDLPPEYRGSSRQVCGLWPFSSGSGAPLAGAPLGQQMITGQVVGLDHFGAFEEGLIPNPSVYFMSNPALGKSTAVGKMCLWLAYRGVPSMYLGDVKGEHVLRTRKADGKVNRLGAGRGYLNPLDPGGSARAVERLTGTLREEVARGAHEQRKALMMALITVSRESKPSEQEDLILGRALEILYDRHDGVPLVRDLEKLIAEAPEDLRTVVLDRGDMDRYLDATDALRTSLIGIATGSGPLGDMFSRHTTEQLDMTRSVCFDLSALPDTQPQKQAAGLLACWSVGFEAVNTAQVLADAGLEPRRNYNIVLDEFWRALRVGRGIVDKADSLTRLNRNEGVGQMMISHTLKDFEAVADETDRAKAKGFVERCAMVVLGGLGAKELSEVEHFRRLTRQEKRRVESWADVKKITTNQHGRTAPYGRGKFLIKLGQAPGIPVQMKLTGVEDEISDTNTRWESLRKQGASTEEIEREIFGEEGQDNIEGADSAAA